MDFSLFSPSTWSNPLAGDYSNTISAPTDYQWAGSGDNGSSSYVGEGRYTSPYSGDKWEGVAKMVGGIGTALSGFGNGNGKNPAPAARGINYRHEDMAKQRIEALPKFSRSGPASMVSTQAKLENFAANLRAHERMSNRTLVGESNSIGGRLAASKAATAYRLGQKYSGG